MESCKPISETKVLPVNGKVLIKIVVKGLSTGILVSKSAVSSHDEKEYYIAGTSVDGFKIGDRVILDAQNISQNMIDDPDNKNSYKRYHDEWGKYKPGEKQAATQRTPKIDIVEYAIVHYNMINAIITK